MAELERYLLTEEQEAMRAMTREFVDKEVLPMAKEHDVTGEFPWELVKVAADMGYTTMSLPEEYGGQGMDLRTYAIVKEEMARGDAGFSVTLGACFLGVMPVKLHGTKEQMKLIGEVLTSGKLTAFGLTEATAGSDSAALKTTYKKDGDDFILNGTKTFITNGGVADLYTVFATKDPSLGAKGISAFIMTKDMAGVSTGKEENKMGIRTSNTADVIMEDVRIPKEYLIGEEGEGFKIAMNTLNHTRPTSGAGSIGNAVYAYEYALQYAQERILFGKPIYKQEAVSFMLADMAMNLEAARQLVLHACDLMDNDIYVPRIFSAAKAFSGDVGMKVCTDAVQICGGYGFSRDYPVEKRMRDAKIFQIFEGTNQIQRLIISNEIKKSVK